MAGTTLAAAEAQLTLWIEASAAVAGSQSYTIGNRSLTRADLGEIREMIEFWETRVARLDPTKRKPTRYVDGGA